MTVYRYENPFNGHGPYSYLGLRNTGLQPGRARLNRAILLMKRRHWDARDHPDLWSDNLLLKNFKKHNMTSRHFFGFSGLAQLNKWFNAQERRILKSAGFVLKKYNVPIRNVFHGSKQVLFLCLKRKMYDT